MVVYDPDGKLDKKEVKHRKNLIRRKNVEYVVFIYGLYDKLKLVVYPSKKVIAKIRGKTKKKLYQATFSIHNTTSNQWAEGKIIENSQWLHTIYTIEWNGSHLSIISYLITPWIVDIVDSSKSELLAQSQRRWFSWKYKYQLDLFSDRSIYLHSLWLVEVKMDEDDKHLFERNLWTSIRCFNKDMIILQDSFIITK
ncbi:unnamed protein product [Adineta ricciae]|uniref:Uncharacterized protein n=1 Tax=Adineta ricciae TaxID=249248 RepID=A0A813NKC9_ADIRI|nr:unnamed protein product [Adineta ricciae]